MTVTAGTRSGPYDGSQEGVDGIGGKPSSTRRDSQGRRPERTMQETVAEAAASPGRGLITGEAVPYPALSAHMPANPLVSSRPDAHPRHASQLRR